MELSVKLPDYAIHTEHGLVSILFVHEDLAMVECLYVVIKDSKLVAGIGKVNAEDLSHTLQGAAERVWSGGYGLSLDERVKMAGWQTNKDMTTYFQNIDKNSERHDFFESQHVHYAIQTTQGKGDETTVLCNVWEHGDWVCELSVTVVPVRDDVGIHSFTILPSHVNGAADVEVEENEDMYNRLGITTPAPSMSFTGPGTTAHSSLMPASFELELCNRFMTCIRKGIHKFLIRPTVPESVLAFDSEWNL